MRKWLLLAALLLPMLWLGGTALMNERALGQSREWRIPIQGFDPRDPLRGQYILFTYSWEVEGDESLCRPGACAISICLSQKRDNVVATLRPADTQCAHRVDPKASNIAILTSDVRPMTPEFASRMFVSETRAPELEAQMREGPMVVVAALTPDGRLINRRIEPLSPAP